MPETPGGKSLKARGTRFGAFRSRAQEEKEKRKTLPENMSMLCYVVLYRTVHFHDKFLFSPGIHSKPYAKGHKENTSKSVSRECSVASLLFVVHCMHAASMKSLLHQHPFRNPRLASWHLASKLASFKNTPCVTHGPARPSSARTGRNRVHQPTLPRGEPLPLSPWLASHPDRARAPCAPNPCLVHPGGTQCRGPSAHAWCMRSTQCPR